MYRLPKSLRATIGKQIIENIISVSSGDKIRPANFNERIFSFIRSEMGNLYLKPYNEKIWKRYLTSIDTDWVFDPGRLPLPRLDEIVNAVAGKKEEGYKEQSYFYYPAFGGIQSLYDSLLEQVNKLHNVTIEFDAEVKSLEKEGDPSR